MFKRLEVDPDYLRNTLRSLLQSTKLMAEHRNTRTKENLDDQTYMLTLLEKHMEQAERKEQQDIQADAMKPPALELTTSQIEALCDVLTWAHGHGYLWLTDRAYRDMGYAGSAVLVTAWRTLTDRTDDKVVAFDDDGVARPKGWRRVPA